MLTAKEARALRDSSRGLKALLVAVEEEARIGCSTVHHAKELSKDDLEILEGFGYKVECSYDSEESTYKNEYSIHW